MVENGFDSDGRPGPISARGRNEYAVVIYIPGELGKFLDDLRRELIPHCNPHAHMTVLPPRPLAGTAPAAVEQARVLAAQHASFEIEAREVERFPSTGVIYIGVSRGTQVLQEMHNALNTGALWYQEPHTYHPHLTVAQDFEPKDVEQLQAKAQERWDAYRGPRVCHAEALTFVQNMEDNCWQDLAQFELRALSRR
jgi:2'-5' RNA ligase